MEEAAFSSSFHADASICGEALLVTLEQLQEMGTLSREEADDILRDFAGAFSALLHEHLETEKTTTLKVDGFMTQFNNIYDKWKIDADGVDIRSGAATMQSVHTRLFLQDKTQK